MPGRTENGKAGAPRIVASTITKSQPYFRQPTSKDRAERLLV